MRTLDPARPAASAVAVRDGTIVAVGDPSAVREQAAFARAPEVIDLGGAALVPGLVDAHVHPFWGTELARGVDLAGVRTLDELRARLAAARDTLPAGAWVLAHGAPYEPFAATGLHAELVDDVAGGGPVVVPRACGRT